MNSFYGGPNGRDFQIKKTFTSKNGLTNSLNQDLSLGWTSPVYVGDYVVVSYGLPSDPNYSIYRNLDLNAEGKSYNSTLWRKDYDESDRTVNGLSYTLIASMSGNTPRFSVHKPITVLNADEDPDVSLDISNIDTPELNFSLPQSQILSMKETEVLNANDKPSVEFNDSDDINKPWIKFSLPQSQIIELAQIEQILDAGSDPEVRLDILGPEGSINKPILKFKLPQGQALISDNVSSEKIDANREPYIEFDDSDKNRPILKFYLPQSQVMANPDLQILGPSENPAVSMDDNVNSPKLTFSLPRAVKFYYGDLLGRRENYENEQNELFSGYSVGDYYINAPAGFIYIVTEVSGNTASFDYVACIQSPLPTIVTTPISPYTEDKDQNKPNVTRTFTNDTETAWQLNFELPRIPKPQIEHTYVPSKGEGNATVEIQDTDNIKFSFQVPRGTRLFAGIEVSNNNLSAKVENAEDGDIYINSDTGEIYILQGEAWEKQPDSIQGPVGNALNIIDSYEIEIEDSSGDTVEAGATEIEKKHPQDTVTPEMIFSVTFNNKQDNSQVSYWYYRPKEGNEWKRVQLTGGIQSLLENEYDNEATGDVNNKAYTVHYVNTLINSDNNNKERTTYSKEYIEELLSWGDLSSLSEP